MRLGHFVVMGIFALVSCTGQPDQAPGPGEVEDTASEVDAFEPLPPTRLLRRMSLDLRGRLPELAELEAVEADPNALLSYRDAYLQDPALEDRLVQLLGERWLTLRDEFDLYYYDYDLDEDDEYRWLRGVGQEPLRLLAHVVVEDLPWTEVVTSETVMVNAQLADIWPVEGYPEGGEGWHPGRWADGRPAVGVLASNGLWWTYSSDEFNQNRTRAAALSKLLLCEDLLSRPVRIDNAAALLEAEDVSEMVRSEASCLSCHATIEPLAASLYGFLWKAENAVGEAERYHPERELRGPEELGVEMAYFGEPISGLGELGWAMSGDSRLYRCATETFTELMLRRSLGIDERLQVDELESRFLEEGAVVRPLLAEITELPAYQAGALGPGATEVHEERERLSRVLGPSQLAASVEAISGFRWTWEGEDLMDYDPTGFRIMVGGVDGQNQSQVHSDPSVGGALVQARLAQAGAQHLVAAADAGTGQLSGVDLDLAPESAVLDDLALALWGRRLEPDEVESLSGLWSELSELGGSVAAWEGLIEALLRHPEFQTY